MNGEDLPSIACHFPQLWASLAEIFLSSEPTDGPGYQSVITRDWNRKAPQCTLVNRLTRRPALRMLRPLELQFIAELV
jgi:hypothetical protein